MCTLCLREKKREMRLSLSMMQAFLVVIFLWEIMNSSGLWRDSVSSKRDCGTAILGNSLVKKNNKKKQRLAECTDGEKNGSTKWCGRGEDAERVQENEMRRHSVGSENKGRGVVQMGLLWIVRFCNVLIQKMCWLSRKNLLSFYTVVGLCGTHIRNIQDCVTYL